LAKVTVHVSLNFPHSVEELFQHLAEHENQAKIFNVKVERLADGKTERNGLGSRRRLRSPGLAPFEETITGYELNKRIEYRMTDSWKNPIKGHLGVIVFSPSTKGNGTLLDYTITFDTKIPFMSGFIKSMTESNLRKGLEGLAAHYTKK
jgi:hypothetical protein